MLIITLVVIAVVVGGFFYAKSHSQNATKALKEAGFPNLKMLDGIVYDEVNHRIADISTKLPFIIRQDEVRFIETLNSTSSPTIRIYLNNDLHRPYHDIGFFNKEAQQRTFGRLLQVFQI